MAWRTGIAVFWLGVILCFSFIHLNSSTGDQEAINGDQEDEKLYRQFRMINFRAKALNDTAVFLEWTIGNASNSLDSYRLLNVTTAHGLRSEFVSLTRIGMSKEICRKHSELRGKCNTTILVKPCSNYVFRLGGDRNTEAVTTVEIDPPSLRAELSEMDNAPLKLRWNITCDTEFMMPIYVTLANLKTVLPKTEKLNASCENRMCFAQTNQLRTSPCTQYSLKIDESDLRFIQTPPIVTDFIAKRVPFEYQYVFNWSVSPKHCALDPFIMVSKMSAEISSKKPIYSKLTLNPGVLENCQNGICTDQFKVQPCVTYWVKTSNSSTSAVKLLRPSVSRLDRVYSGDLESPIKLSWVLGCEYKESEFSVSLSDITNQRLNFSIVKANCDGESRFCEAYLTNDDQRLLPCSSYELGMEGTDERLSFNSPPPSSVSILPDSYVYLKNGSLLMSVSFKGLSRHCNSWNTSIELEFIDLTPSFMHLPCHQTDSDLLSVSKRCTVLVQIDQSDVLCRPHLRLRVRPVYSTHEKMTSSFKGNWFNVTIEPVQPLGWKQAEVDPGSLIVNTSVSQQSVSVHWLHPICFQGSTSFLNKLSVFTESKEAPVYQAIIPSDCSRSNSDLEINWIKIENSRIACASGKELQYPKALFHLLPCTDYSLSLIPFIPGDIQPSNITSFATPFTTGMNDSSEIKGLLSADNVDVTLSHLFDAAWQLEIVVRNKENSPCDKHIHSAVVKTADGNLTADTMTCNHSMTCVGRVTFNHFNLCRTLALTIGLVYSVKSQNRSIVIWLDKSIPPVREATNNATPNQLLEVNRTNEYLLELWWNDPVCLNRVVSGWAMEFRNANNSSLIQTLIIPYDCTKIIAANGVTKGHKFLLKDGQLSCPTSSAKYNISLVPCTNYSLVLTPVVEGLPPDGGLAQYSQSVNFATPFDPLFIGVADLKTLNISSTHFEIGWNMPLQCARSPYMDLEIKVTSLRSSFVTSSIGKRMTGCDQSGCHVAWDSQGQMSLIPCTEYNVYVGSSNTSFITLPGDGGVVISADDVTTKISNASHFDLEMTFNQLDSACSALLVAVQLRMVDVVPLTTHTLFCTDFQSPPVKVCTGQVPMRGMSLCESHPVTLLPIYKESSFSLATRWSANRTIEPLLSQSDRSQLETVPQIEIACIASDHRQLVRINWNDPVCWPKFDSASWELHLKGTGSEESRSHRIRWPAECSSGWHLPRHHHPADIFQHKVELQNGHISHCNDSRSISVDSHESDFIFSACSSYWLFLMPVNTASDLLPKYKISTLLNVPIGRHLKPTVKMTASNALGLEWSLPAQCLDQFRNTSMELDVNGMSLEINGLNGTVSECNGTTCTVFWMSSPDLLSGCIEYRISMDSTLLGVLTLSDRFDSHACLSNNGGVTEPSSKYLSSLDSSIVTLGNHFFSIEWIIALSVLGSVFLGSVVGIGFALRKRQKSQDSKTSQLEGSSNLHSTLSKHPLASLSTSEF